MCALQKPTLGVCKNCRSSINCFKLVPCGHFWCEECLVTNYEEQGNAFVCNPKDGSDPVCQSRVTMEFLATLDVSVDSAKFEDVLNQAYWKKFRTKTCPSCKSQCMRINNKDQRVTCPKCQKDFCFFDGKPWKSSKTSGDCGAEGGCEGDTTLTVLLDCSNKIIRAGKTAVTAPEMRMCPNCCSVWCHHDFPDASNCKHMVCQHCKKEFCWFCLSVKAGSWPASCGSYSTACPVAPRQTTYPQ